MKGKLNHFCLDLKIIVSKVKALGQMSLIDKSAS